MDNRRAFCSLCDGEQLLLLVDSHASDGFRAFNSWDVSLGTLLDRVKHDVVANRVAHRLLVINEVKVVDDVVAKAGHEAGSKLDVRALPLVVVGLSARDGGKWGCIDLLLSVL